MDTEAEIVAKKIDSGVYFPEAMNWFHTKFTRPRTEFTYFFIICLISLAALLVAVSSFSEIFPLSPGKNFVMSLPIQPKDHITISSIQEPGETANDSIMKFMLSEYVQSREEYIEEKLDRNFRVVKTFSDVDVFDQFLDDTSTTNPNNPVIAYGKQATINIEINKIRLLDGNGNKAHDGDVKRAIVNYTTVLTFLSDNTQQINQREADITFLYKQITVDQTTGNISQKPEMHINTYKTNPLKKASK